MTRATDRRGPDWWLLILALVAAITFYAMIHTGCATCEPTIIKEPVEVLVPVPVPPVPLELPPVPAYEQCAQETPQGRLACVGRNVVKLREYARALLAEIEAHNVAAAIPQ